MFSGMNVPIKRIIDFGSDQKTVRDNLYCIFNMIRKEDNVKLFETLISKNREKITLIKDVDDIAVLLFQEYRDFRINEVLNAASLEPTDQLKYVGISMIDSFDSLVPLKILSVIMMTKLPDRIQGNYEIDLCRVHEIEERNDIDIKEMEKDKEMGKKKIKK